ncbi:MAG: 2-phospho-L-lactate guanylyltransferase [Armatimonadetes bacterium]|nr:2-phospho-L-lactate guanylyltransferase [Armatimonadota bacterium]
MTVAAVPVKDLSRAKSRLQGAIHDRPALTLRLLGSVVEALGRSGAVDRILVVSPDPRVGEACGELGVEFVRQHGRGLNRALELARDRAVELGARRLLVSLADLPHLSPREVTELLAQGPGVVLAPDREEQGTNLLLCEPPGCIPYRFGPDSLRRHRAEAEGRGLAVRIYRSPGTQRDLDVPAHLGGTV